MKYYGTRIEEGATEGLEFILVVEVVVGSCMVKIKGH